MATYPGAIKTFDARSAGQTIDAAHVGDLQDEVNAIETALKNGFAHHLLFTDATYDIGASGATRPRVGYFSSALAVGTTPATAGAIRLANTEKIRARNAANSADRTLIFLNSVNQVELAESGVHVVLPTSNLGVGVSGFGTNAVGVLGLGNSTVPADSPADMVQLFSVDASAGNATLGLRTEAAVASEAVVSDRTLQVVINGTTYKLCLKA